MIFIMFFLKHPFLFLELSASHFLFICLTLHAFLFCLCSSPTSIWGSAWLTRLKWVTLSQMSISASLSCYSAFLPVCPTTASNSICTSVFFTTTHPLPHPEHIFLPNIPGSQYHLHLSVSNFPPSLQFPVSFYWENVSPNIHLLPCELFPLPPDPLQLPHHHLICFSLTITLIVSLLELTRSHGSHFLLHQV